MSKKKRHKTKIVSSEKQLKNLTATEVQHLASIGKLPPDPRIAARAKIQAEIARLKRELKDSPTQPEHQKWLREAQEKLKKLQ